MEVVNIIMTFLKEYLPLGVLLTFLISLTNIIVTTRTHRKTKFIDIITSERIKWLEIIRNEGSNIISEFTELLNYFRLEIDDVKNQEPSEDKIAEMNYNFQLNYFNAKNSNTLPNNKLWSRTEFIKNLNLFKLRLNYKEDVEINKIIDHFITVVKADYTTEIDISKNTENLEVFVKKLQEILKNEWEKVKKETR